MRRKRLHRILGLSRFLIRPSVRCRCLASKVLGKVLRRVLGTVEPLAAAEGLRLDQFAANEFGGAALGDVRLSRRLVRTASMQAAAPSASIPSAAQGLRALVKGHYPHISPSLDGVGNWV